jgi:hypothetical protein
LGFLYSNASSGFRYLIIYSICHTMFQVGRGGCFQVIIKELKLVFLFSLSGEIDRRLSGSESKGLRFEGKFASASCCTCGGAEREGSQRESLVCGRRGGDHA